LLANSTTLDATTSSSESGTYVEPPCAVVSAVSHASHASAKRAGELASQRSGSWPYETAPARVEQPGVLPGYDVAFWVMCMVGDV
jgi:hypothetical protein